MAGHPNRAVLVLHDGVDVPVSQSIPRGELRGRVTDDSRHSSNRAETDPQAAVARREDRCDTVVRQGLAAPPRKELHPVEPHQSRSHAQPQIAVVVLCDVVDSERERALLLRPVGQRVVGERDGRRWRLGLTLSVRRRPCRCEHQQNPDNGDDPQRDLNDGPGLDNLHRSLPLHGQWTERSLDAHRL